MQVFSVNNDYASGKRRLVAFMVDWLVLHSLFSLFIWHWLWNPFEYDWNFHNGIFHVFGFQPFGESALYILYSALMESSRFQGTLGKIALGIKVVDHNNLRLQFSKALLRNVAKILSGVILLIGYIMIIFDDRKQGLHDKIADTFVVKV